MSSARSASPIESLYGIHPVLEALRARRRALHRLDVRRGRAGPEVERVVRAARAVGIAVRRVGAEELARRLAPGVQSQGVVLEAGPLPELPLRALAQEGRPPRTLVALDGVEDPRNAGAIARAAEASGPGD